MDTKGEGILWIFRGLQFNALLIVQYLFGENTWTLVCFHWLIYLGTGEADSEVVTICGAGQTVFEESMDIDDDENLEVIPGILNPFV